MSASLSSVSSSLPKAMPTLAVVYSAPEPLASGLPISASSRSATRDRVVRRHRLRQDDRELVAAEAGRGVPGTDRALDAPADLVQHLVAEVVAPAVVDPLEVVEVDVQQPCRLPLVVPQLDRVLQPLVEEGAVREAGQRVVQGELPQLVLRLALARDVEEVALEVERPSVLVHHDDALVAEMDDAPVARDEPVLEAERLVRLVRVHVRGEHAVAILRVEEAREELRFGRPVLDAVAQDRLDLPAREDVGADRVDLVEIDDEGELLDQRAVAPDGLVRRQVVVARAERKRGRRHTSRNRSPWRRAPPPDGVSDGRRLSAPPGPGQSTAMVSRCT